MQRPKQWPCHFLESCRSKIAGSPCQGRMDDHSQLGNVLVLVELNASVFKLLMPNTGVRERALVVLQLPEHLIELPTTSWMAGRSPASLMSSTCLDSVQTSLDVLCLTSSSLSMVVGRNFHGPRATFDNFRETTRGASFVPVPGLRHLRHS